MSYCRNPHYIYGGKNYVSFNGIEVKDECINAFLYKIFLKCNREDLIERLEQGRDICLNKREESYDLEGYSEWLLGQEDEIISQLIGL